MVRKWVLTAIVTAIAGCATSADPDYRPLGEAATLASPPLSHYSTHNPYHPRPMQETPVALDEPEEPVLEAQIPLDPAANPLADVFYDHYKEWRGTRYRLGGMSKSGIDCSGFVYVTFLDRLGIELPRSTHYQVQRGKDIARTQLQTGDLVFFRNGKTNHVGIYLENGKFMHSSTKSGVRISSLSNSYWQRTYWKAKRLSLPAEYQLAQTH